MLKIIGDSGRSIISHYVNGKLSITDIAILIISAYRGFISRPLIQSCGERLIVRGRLIIIQKNSHIRFGDDVLLYPGIKFSVIGNGSKAIVSIGNRSSVGDRTEIHCCQKISIGDDVRISWDVVIMDTDYHSIDSNSHKTNDVEIGNRVWIGCHSIILKGVRIGNGAVVAAGSVVTHDIPPGALVAGNPARIVRENVAWER
jgi:acetyltransferase-like isoleucine patch superfamily enzyme